MLCTIMFNERKILKIIIFCGQATKLEELEDWSSARIDIYIFFLSSWVKTIVSSTFE